MFRAFFGDAVAFGFLCGSLFRGQAFALCLFFFRLRAGDAVLFGALLGQAPLLGFFCRRLFGCQTLAFVLVGLFLCARGLFGAALLFGLLAGGLFGGGFFPRNALLFGALLVREFLRRPVAFGLFCRPTLFFRPQPFGLGAQQGFAGRTVFFDLIDQLAVEHGEDRIKFTARHRDPA